MAEPRKRTALPPRVVPHLTAEQEALWAAISAPENAHIFSLEAVSKAFAHINVESTDMTAHIPAAAPKLRKVPKLTTGQIALHGGISKNAHLFSLDAVSKSFAHPKQLRPEMTDLERKYLILWIANDLTLLLASEGAEQDEAFKALAVELECACARWLNAGA